MYLRRTFAAAAVAVVVAAAAAAVAAAVVVGAVAAVAAVGFVAAVLLKDWTMTVGTFSKDETLFLQRRRPVGVGTWWSTCCTARPTWPAGCRANPDGPENTNQRQLVLLLTVRSEKAKNQPQNNRSLTVQRFDPLPFCGRALKIFSGFLKFQLILI